MGSANSSEVKGFWLCPLYSFDGYSGNVELAEGIQIKSFSALPRLSDYIQKQTHDFYGQWDDPSEYNGVLLLPYCAESKGVSDPAELARIGYLESDRASDLLFDLVTALRLCHEGKITAGPLVSSSINLDSQWAFGSTVVWTSVSQRDFLQQEPKYVLHQSDVLHVNELVSNLAKLRKSKKFDAVDIALRRFNSAYHGNIEDRLIDQMIAFESLYLGDDKELTYKLALRAVFLIGKTKDKRYTIFGDMKKAYRYRSRIVHGDNPPSRDELRAIVPKTEEYLRQSIRRFLLLLSQGMSLNEMRNKLDENILKNGKPLALGK